MNRNDSDQVLEIVVACLSAITLSVGAFFIVPPLFGPFDPFGSFTLTVAVILFASGASLRKVWRPAMASFVASCLVVWSWIAAYFGAEALSGGDKSGFSILFSTVFIGLTYVCWFRPKGKAEVERQEKVRRELAVNSVHEKFLASVQVENETLLKLIVSAVSVHPADSAPGEYEPKQVPLIYETPTWSRGDSIRKLRAAKYGR